MLSQMQEAGQHRRQDRAATGPKPGIPACTPGFPHAVQPFTTRSERRCTAARLFLTLNPKPKPTDAVPAAGGA